MKIAVVGAGPAGSIAAKCCAKENDVTIYEEHTTQPVQCAGLVSITGLGRLGIKPPKDAIKNTVSGARIISPSGSSFLIRAKTKKAYVLDRSSFDSYLLSEAEDAGAVLSREHVKQASSLDAEKIILATGTNYHLHQQLRFQKPKNFLVGAQYELPVDCDPDTVELHFNVPEFFSWIIPAGDRCRVGCCATKNPLPHLDAFIKKLSTEGRIKTPKIIDKSFGIIPIYDPRLPTDYGRIILVGDAAGQVKASTGGGVVMGGLAATQTPYPDYERRWRTTLGKELSLHLRIHNTLAKLSDKNKDRLLSLIAQNTSALETEGDMDLATKSVTALLSQPAFSLRLLAQLPYFLPDLL
jgi:geranylgeranyl reductase family protein